MGSTLGLPLLGKNKLPHDPCGVLALLEVGREEGNILQGLG